MSYGPKACHTTLRDASITHQPHRGGNSSHPQAPSARAHPYSRAGARRPISPDPPGVHRSAPLQAEPDRRKTYHPGVATRPTKAQETVLATTTRLPTPYDTPTMLENTQQEITLGTLPRLLSGAASETFAESTGPYGVALNHQAAPRSSTITPVRETRRLERSVHPKATTPTGRADPKPSNTPTDWMSLPHLLPEIPVSAFLPYRSK